LIRGGSNGGKECGSCSRKRQRNGVIISDHRNSGGNREGGDGKGKGQSRTGAGLSVKSMEGVCGWFGRKPYIIIHLNIEGNFQGVRKQRMGVI
jgi:hypothetical protein